MVFTSDNGAALVSRERAGSNGPLLCGKQTTFEGGMRTPTIAWWSPGPGNKGQRRASGKVSPRGVVSQYVGTHMDLLPTLASLAGAPLPPELQLDGHSMVGVISGHNTEDTGHPVFFYRGNLLYAVRWTQYKVSHLDILHHSVSECGFQVPKTYQAPAHIWDLPR